MAPNGRNVCTVPVGMGVAVMAKTLAGGPRGKWHWLRDFPKRAKLLALVTGAAAPCVDGGKPPVSLCPADLDGFDLTAEQKYLVCWDALGVRARLANQSWRSIAECVVPHRSYETWRTVFNLYTAYSDKLFADAPGLKLSKRAKEVIGEKVLKDWLAGRIDTRHVAAKLGERVSAKHALYWLRRRARQLGLTP